MFIPLPESSSARADLPPLHLGLRSTRFHFPLGVTRWLVSAVCEQGNPASVPIQFLLVGYRSCSRFSEGSWSPCFLFRSFYSRQVQHPWLLELVDFSWSLLVSSWSLVCSSRSAPHQRFLLCTLFPRLVFALSISWSTPGAGAEAHVLFFPAAPSSWVPVHRLPSFFGLVCCVIQFVRVVIQVLIGRSWCCSGRSRYCS
jgi:hypothetical protein